MTITNRLGGKIRQIGLIAILAGLVTVSLVACGGDNGTNTTQPTNTTTQPANTAAPTTGAAATEPSGGNMEGQVIELSEWAIKPDKLELPAGMTKFVATNVGEFTHNVVFRLEGQGMIGKSPDFKKEDGPQTFEVDLKPGTYKMVCTIAGHEESGMVGTLTVK